MKKNRKTLFVSTLLCAAMAISASGLSRQAMAGDTPLSPYPTRAKVLGKDDAEKMKQALEDVNRATKSARAARMADIMKAKGRIKPVRK